MRHSLILACVTLAVSTGSLAQTVESSSLADIFESSNLAAARGDHARSVSGYRRLVDAGVRDPDVFFNLGTAHAQAGDYPRAILNYERALELRPNDDETQRNLQNAEQRLEERRAEVEGEAMIQHRSSVAEAIYARFTEDALAYLLLIANFVFFSCLAWAWRSRKRSGAVVAAAIIASFILAFSALGIGVKAGMFRDGPRAVALEERVALREGPDQRARARGEARGGDRAEIVGVDGDFVKLRMVSGLAGWAPAKTVGLIDLDERLH